MDRNDPLISNYRPSIEQPRCDREHVRQNPLTRGHRQVVLRIVIGVCNTGQSVSLLEAVSLRRTLVHVLERTIGPTVDQAAFELVLHVLKDITVAVPSLPPCTSFTYLNQTRLVTWRVPERHGGREVRLRAIVPPPDHQTTTSDSEI